LSEVRDCDALILAGGLGTRMRAISGDAVSKVLLPVGGMPVLEHILRLLAADGFTNVVLCVGHARTGIMEFCGDGRRWGLSVMYSIEESPLGTGGAVLNALHAVHSSAILVLNGDTLIEQGLARMVAEHRTRQAGITLGVVQVEDRSRYGAVTLDAAGRVLAFEGKGHNGPGDIYSGCCVVTMADLAAIRDRWQGTAVSLESDIIPRMVLQHPAYGCAVQGLFIDTGTPEDYQRAQTLATRHD
jgi:D-glycero-alpha-D-manno-heptose 1-phosphate guanylyltransferase